ncbi:MAG: nucleotide sugar dehydrogenase [Phycisphaerales bacterium]
MNIAFIGIGKLGFPCAVALAMKGHTVYCYDTSRELVEGYKRGEVTPFEPGLPEQYERAKGNMVYCSSIDEAVGRSESIFVAVPTPHAPQHDGSFPYDGVARNFDNAPIRSCLVEVGRAIGRHVKSDSRFRTILVISTTTPGTMSGELGPATEKAAGRRIGDGWTMVYNPFFIGQSTVVQDFLHPEFVLLGTPANNADAGEGERVARELYGSLHSQPICPMTWTEAETVKLAYNTYLGLKVLFANTVMELCHRMPDANCDVVNATLKLAKDRLISSKYMDGGMADGGPCHGRDQMAMSYTAQQLGLRFNIFDTINHGRDAQTGWLADLIMTHRAGRPVVLLGMAFKPNTNQTQGSPAILLANILRQRGVFPVMHDPILRPDAELPERPAVYFISTRWTEYKQFPFKAGDTVIDPWRMLSGVPEGVEYVPVGKPSAAQAIEVKANLPAAVNQ